MHRTARHLPTLAATLLLALAAAGCGGRDDDPRTTTTNDAPPADATDNPAPKGQTQPGPGPVKLPGPNGNDPRTQTAARYAVNAVSYTPETWIDQQTRLRQLAVGEELEQLDENASDLQTQQQALLRNRQNSAGRVLGVDLARAGETAATVVVVLKVTATGQGRSAAPDAADYEIAEVDVTRTSEGWRVSRFEIQP